MTSTILIVGEDHVLSETRALLLREWGITTAHPGDAPELIRNGAYDVLIVCQSVRDTTAQQILAEALRLHPSMKCLAISGADGTERQLSAPVYVPSLSNPAGLRDAVAALLHSC